MPVSDEEGASGWHSTVNVGSVRRASKEPSISDDENV